MRTTRERDEQSATYVCVMHTFFLVRANKNRTSRDVSSTPNTTSLSTPVSHTSLLAFARVVREALATTVSARADEKARRRLEVHHSAFPSRVPWRIKRRARRSVFTSRSAFSSRALGVLGQRTPRRRVVVIASRFDARYRVPTLPLARPRTPLSVPSTLDAR